MNDETKIFSKEILRVINEESKKHLEVKKAELKQNRWISGSKSIVITLAILISVSVTLMKDIPTKVSKHIAVIPINGAIQNGSAKTDGLLISDLIDKAMKDDSAKAVLLRLDSPGGSPTTAEAIYKTIMKYSNADKKIYASIDSMCASACYYIAAATHKIYALDASVIGSIGVRIDSWYLNDFINSLGIKKQIFKAGNNKTILDSFHKMSDEQTEFIQTQLLDTMHNQFIDAVIQARATKLKADPQIFSGLIWSGAASVEKGLIDAISSPSEVISHLKTVYDVESTVKYLKPKFSFSSLLQNAIETSTRTFLSTLEVENNKIQIK